MWTKNAAYPPAIDSLTQDQTLPETTNYDLQVISEEYCEQDQ